MDDANLPHAHPISLDEIKRMIHPVHLPQLHLRFSERKLLLAGVDLLALNTAFVIALALRSNTAPFPQLLWEHPLWFGLLGLVWLMVGQALDIYDLARAASALHSAWAAAGAAILTASIYLLIPWITPALPIRRMEIVFFPLLALAGVTAWRFLYAGVLVQPAFSQRALVVGAGWSGQALAQAIAKVRDHSGNPYRGTGYHILGFVDDDPAKQGQAIGEVPVLGTRHDLPRLARELRPDEIIIAITHLQSIHGELFQAILDCREMGISITTAASLYERITGRVPVEHAGRDLYVLLPIAQPAAHRVYLAARQLVDIILALLGCALVGMLAPVVWLANRFTSPGDLFYRQERVGEKGQIFRVIKFRSMVMNAENGTGAVWAARGDARVTPVGRILRKTRIDELPQFWNVLRGEMSLIGPRPERPEFVQQLAEDIPFYRARHAVKPGITGWAQVKYRYASSVDDALVKLQYDLYYIKHMSFYLDLLIVLKTIQVVLGFKGQ